MGHKYPESWLVKGRSGLAGNSRALNDVLNHWYWSEALGNWPHFNPVTGLAPTYRHVPSDYATIAAATAAANYSDIITLSAGTYVEDVDLPLGVTLRSADCSEVVIDGQLVCQGDNTVRHVTVRHNEDIGFLVEAQRSAWFEDCTFENTNGAPNETYLFDAGGESLVFRRCTFTATASAALYTAAVNYFEFVSNIVDTNATYGPLVYATPYAALVANNLFLCYACPDAPLQVDAYSTLDVEINGNVFIANDYAGAQVYNYGAPGTSNYYYLVDTDPLLTDNVEVTSLDQLDLEGSVPRNEAVQRLAGTFSGPVLDRARHPFDTTRSAGPYQWRADASAFYRPRYDLDLLSASAFAFVYNRLLDGVASTYVGSDRTYSSHDEVACHINLLVGDICHPSRGQFYVTYDGYFRLTVDEADFDLTLSGDAAIVLGAYDMDAQTDTG